MRVRKLDANGDMQFGHGLSDYWINDYRGVGQVIWTRLRLWQGQWFLNVQDGTPWMTQVLGKYTEDLRDLTVQDRIYGTPGVVSIRNYDSELNRQSRDWTVHAEVDTIYGAVQIQGPF